MANKISDICKKIQNEIITERKEKFNEFINTCTNNTDELCIIYPEFSNKKPIKESIKNMDLKQARRYATYVAYVCDDENEKSVEIQNVIDECIEELNDLVDQKLLTIFDQYTSVAFSGILEAFNYDTKNRYRILGYYYDDQNHYKLYAGFWYTIYTGLERTTDHNIPGVIMRRLNASKKTSMSSKNCQYCGFITPTTSVLYCKGFNHMLMSESINRSSYIGFVFRNQKDKLIELYINISRKKIENERKLLFNRNSVKTTNNGGNKNDRVQK